MSKTVGVQHGYDRWAVVYDEDENPLQALEKLYFQDSCGDVAGLTVLDLGCGWGSKSLWLATRFPNWLITAVSNSHHQREFIENQCRHRGIGNVMVTTADMNEFDTTEQYDRVVSIEMFEHLRNFETAFERIDRW